MRSFRSVAAMALVVMVVTVTALVSNVGSADARPLEGDGSWHRNYKMISNVDAFFDSYPRKAGQTFRVR